MGFAKEITDKCLKDEYWKELSQKVLDNSKIKKQLK